MAAAALVFAAPHVSGAEPEAFHGNVEKLTLQNKDFRRVLFTGRNVQVVAMSLPEKLDIGEEVHNVDQCFFFVDGEAETTVKGKVVRMRADSLLCVPAGARHNIRNAGPRPLKLYTLYAPPQHPTGTVHHTKADAERAEKAGQKPKK
jgi:mannose-6-phosphate isomerase-like protein (cupin superfamily)